ncbi:MAG TPA: hypothetical protein PKE16_12840 [Hyphomicrobium sp.]|nr:hypothetical protein [Hyphomicrobium sp.]
MTLSRIFAALALSSAVSLAGTQVSLAQSLSDSSLALSSSSSSGYMGLGGNLNWAMEHRQRGSHRVKTAKSARAARTENHSVRRRSQHVQTVSYKPTRRETPTYLIGQVLDQSGLTINTLRLQHYP